MQRFITTVSLLLGLTSLTWTLAVYAQKDDSPAREPLLKIMQDLGVAMNQMNNAIFMEDYQGIDRAAKKISDHPMVMPAELKTIVKTLGFKMPQFKKWDTQVHDSAVDISKAAKTEDMSTILEKYSDVMNGCVNCHSNFRTKVQKALRK
jgi:cytochrome c556